MKRKMSEEFLRTLAKDQMVRLLSEASGAVSLERMEDYGRPTTNYKRIASLWNAYFQASERKEFNENDIVIAMILTKIARLIETPDHYDSWKDIAGYAAVAWSIASDPATSTQGEEE